MTNQLLSTIYYNPEHEGSFSTAKKLYEAAKLVDSKITLKGTQKWLSGELTYTLHKPARKRFKRNPVIVSHIDEQWQADLIDLQEFQSQNRGYRYILTIIDIFSKYAFVIPMKTKTSEAVTSAFKQVFTHRKPTKLQTDKGKEFVNSLLQSFLKQESVYFFTSKNPDIKCSIIERFNRTLKARMFKYFTSKGTRRYLEVLDQLVTAYNNTVHSATKFRPSAVTKENEREVFQNLCGKQSLRDLLLARKVSRSKLTLGDTVRQKYHIGPFEKSYHPLWSDQLFTVTNKLTGPTQSLYKLKTADNTILDRRFYPEEVQKVRYTLHRVEKVLKRRKRAGLSEYYVKWLNYPSSFNSWIPATDIVNL